MTFIKRNGLRLAVTNVAVIVLLFGCKKDDAPPPLNWSPLLRNQAVISLVAADNKIFASTLEGILLSIDNGVSWVAASNDLIAVTDLALNDGKLYAATQEGVFVSVDNGVSWGDTGLPSEYFTCLAVASTDIFAGDYGNVLSMNTKNSVTTGLANQQVTSLALGGDNIYVGTGGGVFLVHGNTCALVMPDQYVYSVVASGSSIFAATGFQSNGAIFFSGDGGISWSKKLQISVAVNCLAVSGSKVLAGTSDGVYFSDDNGSNWVATGLSKQNVVTFAIVGASIFAGTNSGVFISSIK